IALKGYGQIVDIKHRFVSIVTEYYMVKLIFVPYSRFYGKDNYKSFLDFMVGNRFLIQNAKIH
ncbi:hypothetical protein, partial [Muriicola sp.]|uniref:hypothetical protein n=1 Tax=Muriicola sp. TaxID=2020856 RepID=UPI003C75978C